MINIFLTPYYRFRYGIYGVKNMSKIIESAINWYGGKGGTGQRKLLADILKYIEKSECTKFVDVFGGSGIVCLNVAKDIRIYNDIDVNGR